jgi:hypothetical protein
MVGTGKKFCSTKAAFFTPNGDGANDHWNLKDLTEASIKTRKYSFSIDTESCSNN